MKTVTISEAQASLSKLTAQPEPVLLTDGAQPIAVLLHLGTPATNLEIGGCLISVTEKAASPVPRRDWWEALQRIEAGQKERGFVGTVADIDRDDQGYEERMKQIEEQTVSRDGAD